MKKAGVEPPMPPNPAPHIVDRLVEMGLSEAAGMGVVPLSWGEIVAWQAANCVRLEPWEAKLIRTLSAAYVTESRRAECENAPSPWRAPVSDRERAADLRSLEQLLG